MHTIRHALSPLLLLACLAFGATFVRAGETTPVQPTKGYSCVFLGHSFFVPIAQNFGQHPARAGFPEHRQIVVSKGGAEGSPGRLWASLEPDHEARKAIRSGSVDLIGLTCYPDVGSSLADYQRWIDFAREHNPRTRFFIMIPWPRYWDRTHAQYEAQWLSFEKAMHGLIDQLRELYPDNEIFCIPEGRWMVELWRLFEKGDLPEVSVLMRPTKQSTEPCLFRDRLGHGGDLPVKAGTLIWLAAIYRVDVRQYAVNTGTRADLKGLAWKIVSEDPYTNVNPSGQN
jgi:hypothetical protein